MCLAWRSEFLGFCFIFWFERRLMSFQDMNKYGLIFRSWLFTTPMISINDPEALRNVGGSPASYDKSSRSHLTLSDSLEAVRRL
jgi:hypothetical protein